MKNFKELDKIFDYQDLHRVVLDYDSKHIVYKISHHGNHILDNIQGNIQNGRVIKDRGFKVEFFLSEKYFFGLFESPTYRKDFKEFFLDFIQNDRLALCDSNYASYKGHTDYDSLKWVTKDTIEKAYGMAMEKRRIDSFFSVLLNEGRAKKTKLKYLTIEKRRLNRNYISCLLSKKVSHDLIEKYFDIKGCKLDSWDIDTFDKLDLLTIQDIKFFESQGAIFDKESSAYKKIVSMDVFNSLGN